MIRIIAFTVTLFFCGLAVAEKAPQLVLENIDGTTFSLDEARKKGPVVFDFWATWCNACIKGLPKIQALSKEYAEHGVQVLTINIDGPRNLPKVRPFMQRHKLELPVLLDPYQRGPQAVSPGGRAGDADCRERRGSILQTDRLSARR